MARLFAIADLHLSGSGDKPMDLFGEHWRDHARRIADAWDERVAEEDSVLLPGDLSWAKKLDEAGPDLAWIGERPGSKLLLRGNHDSWWSSVTQVRDALPRRCEVLQNDAHRAGPWVVVGARGWTAPNDPLATPADLRVFRREVERLRVSIRFADAEFERSLPRLAMLHYPPWVDGAEPTEVVEVLRRAGVSACVYGHLHGDDHRLAVQGVRMGIRFQFVACDAIDFAPVEVPAPGNDLGEPK